MKVIRPWTNSTLMPLAESMTQGIMEVGVLLGYTRQEVGAVALSVAMTILAENGPAFEDRMRSLFDKLAALIEQDTQANQNRN